MSNNETLQSSFKYFDTKSELSAYHVQFAVDADAGDSAIDPEEDLELAVVEAEAGDLDTDSGGCKHHPQVEEVPVAAGSPAAVLVGAVVEVRSRFAVDKPDACCLHLEEHYCFHEEAVDAAVAAVGSHHIGVVAG